METNQRRGNRGFFIVLSPLLLPLVVLIGLTLTRRGIMTPPTQAQVQMTQPMPSPTAIAWTGSLDWALQTARSTNKPIMIDFYTDT